MSIIGLMINRKPILETKMTINTQNNPEKKADIYTLN